VSSKVIISGLSPGFGGVPRLLEYLSNYLGVITPRRQIKWFSNRYLQRIALLFDWLFNIAKSRASTAVVTHHFSIPTIALLFIHLKFKKVEYFAIDNSFFCIKSYNFRQGIACRSCLNSSWSLLKSLNCEPFPNKKWRINLILDQLLIRNWVGKNKSYSLSRSNSSLLHQHFDVVKENVTLHFTTLELIESIDERNKYFDDEKYKSPKKDSFEPKIVFHGAKSAAKGFNFALELARALPEVTFIFPFHLDEADCAPENCEGRSMTWDYGLKENIATATIVLCPSIWTYTPEASMLKSFLYTDDVFFLKPEDSFGNEIPMDLGIHGSGCVIEDSILIRKKIVTKNIYIKNTKGIDFVVNFTSFFDKNIEMLTK